MAGVMCGVSPSAGRKKRAPAPFSPTSVATVDLWVSSTAGAFSDNPPTAPAEDTDPTLSVVDQASGIVFTPRIAGEAPTYDADGLPGGPALDFVAASNNNLRATVTSLASGTTHHFFWALDVDAVGTAGGTQLARFNSLDLIVYLNNPSSRLGFYDGAHKTSTQAPATGVQLLELQLDGAGGTGQFFVDGSAVGGSLAYTPRAIDGGAMGLLAASDGSSGFVDTQFGHFVHSTAILAGDDLTNMRAFLSAILSA